MHTHTHIRTHTYSHTHSDIHAHISSPPCPPQPRTCIAHTHTQQNGKKMRHEGDPPLRHTANEDDRARAQDTPLRQTAREHGTPQGLPLAKTLGHPALAQPELSFDSVISNGTRGGGNASPILDDTLRARSSLWMRRRTGAQVVCACAFVYVIHTCETRLMHA